MIEMFRDPTIVDIIKQAVRKKLQNALQHIS